MVMYITPFDIPTFTLFEMDSCPQRKAKPTETERSPAAYAHHTDDNQTVLQVDLPGVEKEHVSVEVKDHKLTVTGKRYRFTPDSAEKTEKPAEDSADDQQTCVVYKRTFTLARTIDVAAVSAQGFENGVLSLVLPKKTQVEARRIAIE